MTKRDIKYIAGGVAAGGVLFGLLFYVFRRGKSVPEIDPSKVNWIGAIPGDE